MTHSIPVLSAKDKAGERSCTSCKFFTEGTEANTWGQPAVPGHCSTYGNRPVDLTIMTRDEVESSHVQTASKCPRYNDPKFKASPTLVEIQVGIPAWDPDSVEVPDVQRAKCNSCLQCKNWVADLPGDIGLDPRSGLCLAKGTMIQNDKHREAAQRCKYKEVSQSVNDRRAPSYEEALKMVRIYPAYDMVKFRDRVQAETLTSPGGLPVGYDPDQFIAGKTPNEDGIAGTVSVTDPSGSGNVVELPVFGDVFDATESAKIPRSADDERPDLYIDWEGLVYSVAVAWRELDETPAVIGPPGVGKTELYRHMAWIMRVPLERMTITNSTELDDLQGSMQFVDGQTQYKYGRVPLSWKKPGVLLMDEPNVGPRDVWQFLRPLTDNSKQLVIDAADGVPIKRHDNCYLGFAMNPAWDVRNDGASELADADIRRLFHIYVGYPSRDVEAKIIKNHCLLAGFEIPDQVLEWVQTAGSSLRKLADSGSLPISWGLGQQIKVAKLLNWFMPLQAYNLAAGNYLEPEMRQIFLADVLAVYPNG